MLVFSKHANGFVWGYFVGDSILGVRFGQDGNGEEGEDAAGVGVCANESDGLDGQEGEGIHERQHNTTQKSK